MESYQSILAKISIFQKKAEALRENEKKLILAEIRKLVEMYTISPAELFSPDSQSQKPAPTRHKRVVTQKPPKYRDPATGKTWNGHGKRPFWLVGDKEAFLMTEEELLAAKKPKAKRKPVKRAKRSPKLDAAPQDA